MHTTLRTPLAARRAAIIVFVTLVALAAACNRKDAAPAEPAPSAAPAVAAAAALERVEPSKVCMMNDRFMNVPQLPVEVDGKTYYGCCAMCEKRLKADPGTRSAVDPMTKQRVDKATAVIGKLPSGKVLYFASEQSLRSYSPS